MKMGQVFTVHTWVPYVLLLHLCRLEIFHNEKIFFNS